MRRALGIGCLATACALLASCSVEVPATEVLVVIDATDAVKARAAMLRVDVSGSDARGGPYGGTVLQSYPAAFPRRVALVPRNDDPHRFFQVNAIAFDAGGGLVASLVVRSTYVEHRFLELRLVLDATPCVPGCSGDTTCRDGRCEPLFVDPGTLPDVDGGRDDLGGHDGGMDAPSADADAGDTGDGGIDFGPIDLGMPDAPGCTTDRECSDGIACNGDEKCDHGACMPGTPVVCDDHVACTVDTCNEPTGICVYTATDAMCTMGAGGHCDAVLGCQYTTCDATTCRGNPLTCDDASCGSDGMCHHTSTCGTGQSCCAGSCMPAGCDDHNPCTTDTCDPRSGCSNLPITGGPCSDGDTCTTSDSCYMGACGGLAVPNGMACDNGDGCTGDVCLGGTCTSCPGTDTCSTTACSGTTCIVASFAMEGLTCATAITCELGNCSAGTCIAGGSGTRICTMVQSCCGGRCFDAMSCP